MWAINLLSIEAIKRLEGKELKLKNPPERLPCTDEEKYTEIFQEYFAEGTSLNQKIATKLRK